MPLDARILRTHIYDWILAHGSPPTSRDLAASFGVAQADAKHALGSLEIGKTVLVAPSTGEVWMAGPFSAVETPYHVIGARTRWFANCAWDVFGVAILANEPVRVETRCTDCAAPMILHIEPVSAPTDAGVVHFLVPARRWYEDIGFT